MNVPKHGGHKKPGPAAKVTPEGYDHMKTCPMCQGKGTVEAGTIKELALRRV